VGKFKERRLDSAARPDEAAQKFRDYLVDPHGGRFAASHVKLLLNDGATQQEVMSAVGSSWLGRLAGQDDLVVVYLATSGFPTTDGNAYLCTYNCALDNVYSTCLSMKALMSILKQEVHCNRIVLIVQSCYSGAAELESGAKALFANYNFDPAKLQTGKGHVIISSSQPDQQSWGNVFTTSMIAALKEEDGLIDLDRAFERAREATERETSSTVGIKRQSPVMKSDWRGHDLVIGAPQVEQVSEIPSVVTEYLGAEAHYLKANRLVEAGKLDDAIAEYNAALAVDPRYADVLADYGAVLAMKADWQGAADKYKLAIAVHPGDGLFHANYARTLSKLGLKDDCRKELEVAYSIEPNDKGVITALSYLLLEGGEPARAAEILKHGIALFPQSSGLHNRLSAALVRSGEKEQALSHAEIAAKLDPASVAAQLNLGSLLLLNGHSQAAIDVYKKSTSNWPQDADAHYLLSQALEGTGDRAGAASELEQFLKNCKENDSRRQEAEQHLKELRSP
jgi:tetratricopeptide (TPR) repeat protein